MPTISEEIEEPNLILPESTDLNEKDDGTPNLEPKNRSSEASEIELFNDKLEGFDELDSDESFGLDEDDKSSDSDQNNFEAKENYRKLLSGDGDNLDNYQFEDNRSDIKEPADSTSQEDKSYIPEIGIKVENNGFFYGKDYFEAEDKKDELFLKELKNMVSQKEDDTLTKEAIEDNRDDKGVDDNSQELFDTANLENRDAYVDDDENEEEYSNNFESEEDPDIMSKEVNDENYLKDSQNREIVGNDNDTMSNENIENNEETYTNNSDSETMSKEVIENDQEEGQKSEDVSKNDDTMSDEIINDDVELNAEPVDLVVEDNNEPKEDNDGDSFEEFDNDDLKELRETWEKLSKDTAESDDISQYEEYDGKPLKPIKNYEDVDDELTEEEENSEIGSIDSNLGDIFNEANSSNDQDLEGKNLLEKSYGDDMIYEKISMTKNIDDDDKNLLSVFDESNKEFDSYINHIVENLMDKQETEYKEYDVQMKDFVAKHKEELDNQSKKVQVLENPVYKTLSADQAVVITHPDSYPINNVYDWILDGDGAGVEFNITYLNLRGDADQYLLIIPGKYAWFRLFNMYISTKANNELSQAYFGADVFAKIYDCNDTH